jgi:hypothetical protein
MATKHVAVRLDEQTLARVDALIPGFSTPWHPAKRSDVLRALIHAGLEVEAKHGPAGLLPGKPFVAGTAAPSLRRKRSRR